ncbi:MAG: hypothetical protein KC468_35930, partial [Myxococcales bacterium]|nr:hypothetical protein [Myxococcales bacterium]
MTSPSKRLSTRARDDAVADRRAELTARVHAVALQLRASATAAPSYAAALERVLGVLVELAARARGRRWEEAHARRGVWDVGAIAGVRAALHETGLSGHVTGEDIGAAYEELMGARGRGDWRRRTGTHYTPRGLTEEVVRETLGPVLRRLGEGASSEALLGLRVLDPAMGCGAFVLEVCRQLGGAVSEAWSREGAHG